jgi:hypothetical protein
VIILPKQARDKHRELSNKSRFLFSQAFLVDQFEALLLKAVRKTPSLRHVMH